MLRVYEVTHSETFAIDYISGNIPDPLQCKEVRSSYAKYFS